MMGLKNVYDRICAFHEQAKTEAPNEDRWAPAPLLKRLAEEGKTFN